MTDWLDTEVRAYHSRKIASLHAHVVPRGGTYVTTLVIPDPVLRVCALDARSRKPIVNAALAGAWVLPAGAPTPTPKEDLAAHAVLHLPQPIEWDLRRDPPILHTPKVGFGKSVGGHQAKEDWSKLKNALNLLGYGAGSGPKSDRRLEIALEQFRTDFLLPSPKPKAKDTTTIPRVIAEYNKRAFKMARRYLVAYGQECPPGEKWDAAAEKALLAWQKIWLKLPDKKLTKHPTAKICAALVAENARHFATDGKGVVSLPIPLSSMKSGFTLVVSFQQFGVIAAKDAPKWRAAGEVLVEWSGKQDLAAGTLGWRLRGPGDQTAVDALPEFRWCHAISVPAIPKLSFADLPAADAAKAGLNAQYGPNAAADVDLIGLVWCQPAWDDLSDPATKESNEHVVMPRYRPDATEVPTAGLGGPRRRHLHIVTKWMGKDPEFYGWLDAPSVGTTHFRGNSNPGYRHKGVDVYVKERGDPVFAVHGGIAMKNKPQPSGAGDWLTVRDPTHSKVHLQYFHLNEVGFDSKTVRAGEIVGSFGHTGNINGDSAAPNHCHMEHHGDVDSNFALASLTGDDENKVCFPSPEETPRVFPCKCNVEETPTLADCRFEDPKFTNGCWAPKRLVCPHMLDSEQTFRRQAQLRYLGETVVVNGTDDKQYKKAINSFRAKNGLPAGDTMDAVVAAALDGAAPIIAPER